MPSRRTALHRRHAELGAKLADLDGWILPRFYRGAEDEFKNVLRSVGICDISHYGKVDVKGTEITCSSRGDDECRFRIRAPLT